MNDNNNFSNDNNTQFVISYELLCLLRWLAENDAIKLKKIVDKALAGGLRSDIERARETKADEHNPDDIQHSIIEFFTVLEDILMQSINEQSVQRAMVKNLMPAIDQIDSLVDDETVRSSVEKATARIDKASPEHLKDVLFKELLRRWKPHDKNVLN